jgi:hypothetical protein
MIEIEKNIYIPPINRNRRRTPSIYPFQIMERNDSFLINCESNNTYHRKMIQTRILAEARRNSPYVFTTRTVPEGIRCWRIR